MAIEADLVDYIDMKRQLEPFLNDIQTALEEVHKTGKLTKLKKLAVTMETVRILGEFKNAVEVGDMKRMEYYGKLIRDHFMDKPKVSLSHSADGDSAVGVVVLPARNKGEAE
jgi:hypothetical protein